MKCNSNNLNRGRWWIAIVAVLLTLSAGGCGDLIPAKSAAVESSRILKELGRVETAPEPNIPLPSFFTAPPKILPQNIAGKLEYKLFYFCQHHTSPELSQIVNMQFASTLFDAKGKSTRVPDYRVSSNAATNQLIVRCPNMGEAEAVLDFLYETDVPPIQVKISCLISEIYADKTLDWETSIEITNLLGEGVWAGPAGRPFASGVDALLEEPSIAAFPGGSLRELARAKMGLKVGYLARSGNFLALVDMLESQGYLKILMNPTLEVVNGKTAKVMSSQKVPLTKTYLRSGNAEWLESRQEYQDVVDSLEITPHVYGDGYIGLETSILIGSTLTPDGIKQVPIVTKKQITNKETRIRPGESLIIGGLRKTERRDVLRGIPFLKDIPIIGVLFSGRDFEERAVETIFILTPTISTGGIPREEMVDDVKRRRGEKTSKDDDEVGLDPFGIKARKKERERELEEAEEARMEAEAEKAVARHAVRDAEDRIEKAESVAELAKARSDRAIAEAKKMKDEAETAKTEADTKAKAADAAKAAAEKATADAAKVKADAAKATSDAAVIVKAAEKAQAEAAKIAADATKTKEEAQQAKIEAEALAKAAEKAKAEADAKATVADAAKVAAEKATADAAKVTKEAEEAKAQADAKAKAAEEATADAAKTKSESEEAKAQADAKGEAADAAKADAEARAKAADRAVAGAERVIRGESPDLPEQDDGGTTAKAEETAPAPEEEKPAAERPEEEDSDKSTPTPQPDKDSETTVAKKEPEPEQNSTPLETPKPGDMIVEPPFDGAETAGEAVVERNLEKPTAKQPEQPNEADEKPSDDTEKPEPTQATTAADSPRPAAPGPNKSTTEQAEAPTNNVAAKAPITAAERNKPATANSKAADDKAKAPDPEISTVKAETKTAKAGPQKPRVVSIKTVDKAVETKLEAEDQGIRLLMLVLSALTL